MIGGHYSPCFQVWKLRPQGWLVCAPTPKWRKNAQTAILWDRSSGGPSAPQPGRQATSPLALFSAGPLPGCCTPSLRAFGHGVFQNRNCLSHQAFNESPYIFICNPMNGYPSGDFFIFSWPESWLALVCLPETQ